MRHPLLLAILVLPATLPAQTAARYRYTSTYSVGTALVDRSANPLLYVTTIEATDSSVVTMSARDTAGMKRWRIALDSTMSRRRVVDSVALSGIEALLGDRAPARPTGLATALPGAVHEVSLRNGTPMLWMPLRKNRDGIETPGTKAVIDSLHANADLSHQLPALGLLFPDTGLPSSIGGTRTDTVAIHVIPSPIGASVSGNSVTLQAPERFDTTITVWTRTAANTIDATATSHVTRPSDIAIANDVTTGNYHITLETDGTLHAATVTLSLRSVSTPVGASRPPGVTISTRRYTLVRIPE